MCAVITGNTRRERNLRFNGEFDQRRGSLPRLRLSIESEHLVISPGSLSNDFRRLKLHIMSKSIRSLLD